MPTKFHLIESLLEPPIKRAAYSDRTAWLMAVMSSLAYIRFEQPTSIVTLAACSTFPDLSLVKDPLFVQLVSGKMTDYQTLISHRTCRS